MRYGNARCGPNHRAKCSRQVSRSPCLVSFQLAPIVSHCAIEVKTFFVSFFAPYSGARLLCRLGGEVFVLTRMEQGHY